MKSSIALLLFLFGFFSTHSQIPCGTDEMYQKLFNEHPEYNSAILRNHKQLELETAEYKNDLSKSRSATFIIPVVFHVVHNYGPENISDAQIYDAVKHVNEQLRLKNPDTTDIVTPFKNLAADTEIEIRLARIDPNGDCTNGITRTVSPLTLPGDHSVKSVIQWPPDQYLNIYVCKDAAGLAGHALLPSAADTIPAWDGIVMKHDYVGTIGTSQFFRRTVVTHEIGHYLNLQHIWGGNNVPNYYYLPVADGGNCSFDDGVSDTPETIGWQSCNLSGNTCNSLDNVQNYMDYSYCARMFTEGQKLRMHAALNSNIASRNNLWSPTNLIATGTDGSNSNLCSVNIGSNTKVICEGETIDFYDLSYHGVSLRNWSFNGGAPTTSQDSTVSVTYNNAGWYPVGLEVGNGATTIDTLINNYVLVLPTIGTDDYLYENFEDSTTFNQKWFYASANDQGVSIYNTGYSSDQSIKFDNFNAEENWIFELTSYPINTSNLNDLQLSFDWSYVQKNQGDNDQLQVLVSSDCGDTWSVRKNINALSSLPTVTSPQNSEFIPASDLEWENEIVSNINSSQFLVNNLMVKFRFISDGGNNFFIDNISISHPDVLSTMNKTGYFSIYPNPGNDEVSISSTKEIKFITVYDLQGRVVQRNNNPIDKKINMKNLSPATYMIQVHFEDESITRKKWVKN